MNILSLFDGMSCGQIAANKAGVEIDNYFASEIKKTAIGVTKVNYPNTIFLGDIKEVNYMNTGLATQRLSGSWLDIPDSIIDLVIGGSPCQSISNLQPGKNIYDEKSRLFFEYLRILNQVKRYNKDVLFLLENVVGDKNSIKIISDLLQVEPIRINSELVSYQKRDRYYWTNIPDVKQPENLSISFQSFKDTDEDYLEQYRVNETPSRITMWNKKCPNVTYRHKINCLTCKQDRWNNAGLVSYKDFCRYLTVRDGWTVDVIAHIFKNIPH